MAYIEKMKSGRWRVQIRRKALPAISKSFDRKVDANAWANEVESSLRNGDFKIDSGITIEEIFLAYLSAKTEGHEQKKRSDIIRIKRFLQDMPFMPLRASELVAEHVQMWIDKRLGQVKPSSVRREYTILRAVLRFGAHKLDAPINLGIFNKVDVPAEGEPRKRNVSQQELKKIWKMCPGPVGRNATSYIPAVFEWCCETAMRKGEALALRHSDIHEQDGLMWAVLHTSKNGSGRVVPMSSRAVAIYRMLPRETSDAPLFRIASGTLDTLFRGLVKTAGIEGLRFHDSRHQATLALSKRLNVLDLAKVTGHKSTAILLNVYYQPSGADLALALATPRGA